MDIDPNIWGPSFWTTYHTYAYTYPERPSEINKSIAKSFIKNIPFVLPCASCANSAYNYILYYSDELDNIVKSRSNMVQFFFDFHNDVNFKTQKRLMSRYEADYIWKQFLFP